MLCYAYMLIAGDSYMVITNSQSMSNGGCDAGACGKGIYPLLKFPVKNCKAALADG